MYSQERLNRIAALINGVILQLPPSPMTFDEVENLSLYSLNELLNLNKVYLMFFLFQETHPEFTSCATSINTRYMPKNI